MVVAGAGGISHIEVVCPGSGPQGWASVLGRIADHSIGIVVDAE
jgi:hypothetical protein